jgi:tetratricopeptide (TPR) repeat protein
MNRPLCFTLVPSGKYPGQAGSVIDFGAIYRTLLAPAITEAELDPLHVTLKAGSEDLGEAVHEQLLLCPYAVVDLATAGPQVLYLLGVRHATRSSGTILIGAEGTPLPFPAMPLPVLYYALTSEGLPLPIPAFHSELVRHLREARGRTNKRSILELVEDFTGIAHTKTDVFRERVSYSSELKKQLAQARGQGVEALRNVETKLGAIADTEAGVVIDLLLSYRAVKAWQEMIELVSRMSLPLARTVMVQEQLAFALNRAGEPERAEAVLMEVLNRSGPSSETHSLLGRVYKDRWDNALKRGELSLAKNWLDQAIDAYRRGFEADWRDALPGINTVTLMELRDPPDPERLKLIPVVRYTVERRINTGTPDYWDYATCIELAVLAKDEQGARTALDHALACIREVWEPETTGRNLRLIRESRERRGEPVSWAQDIEETLADRSRR